MGKQSRRASRRERNKRLRVELGVFRHIELPQEIIVALSAGLRPGVTGHNWSAWREQGTNDLLIVAQIVQPGQDDQTAMWAATSLDIAEHDRVRRNGTVPDMPIPADRRGVFLAIGETAAAVSDWPDRVVIYNGATQTVFGPIAEPVIPTAEAEAILAAA